MWTKFIYISRVRELEIDVHSIVRIVNFETKMKRARICAFLEWKNVDKRAQKAKKNYNEIQIKDTFLFVPLQKKKMFFALLFVVYNFRIHFVPNTSGIQVIDPSKR